MTAEKTLSDGLAALRLDVSLRERLLTYLRLLDKWNKTYNLTAVRGLEAMVSQHVLDSLAVVPHLSGETLVDVGSGAGLPGIPIAMACPDRKITLLDSSHKKTVFLKQAVIELALTNVAVVPERAEHWRSQTFDVVISRAFAELASFVGAAAHLCNPEGVLMAMKGVYPNEELGHIPPGWRVRDITRLCVPLLDADRHLVTLERCPVTAASA